jgi:hypothetical protein
MGNDTTDQIAEMADPIRRNLWITQTYHELGCRLADRGLGEDASWLLFAVWASKTAGRVIRADDLPRLIRDEIAASGRISASVDQVNRRWGPLRLLRLADTLTEGHLHTAIDRVVGQVSEQIATGNRLVFQELVPMFEAILEGRRLPPNPALHKVAALYRDALDEKDEKRRALMVLEANVLAVAHEQNRLQDNIRSALSAPVSEVLHQVLDEDLAPLVPVKVLRSLAKVAVNELIDELSGICQVLITQTMMTLLNPDGSELRLNEDLPSPAGDALFSSPLDSAEAVAVLYPWDRTDGTGRPCGAANWEDLDDRMCYIVNLFRSRQRIDSLRQPPFDDAQLADLRAGRMPTGPL